MGEGIEGRGIGKKGRRENCEREWGRRGGRCGEYVLQTSHWGGLGRRTKVAKKKKPQGKGSGQQLRSTSISEPPPVAG